jgi:hypothetical protein
MRCYESLRHSDASIQAAMSSACGTSNVAPNVTGCKTQHTRERKPDSHSHFPRTHWPTAGPPHSTLGCLLFGVGQDMISGHLSAARKGTCQSSATTR